MGAWDFSVDFCLTERPTPKESPWGNLSGIAAGNPRKAGGGPELDDKKEMDHVTIDLTGGGFKYFLMFILKIHENRGKDPNLTSIYFRSVETPPTSGPCSNTAGNLKLTPIERDTYCFLGDGHGASKSFNID